MERINISLDDEHAERLNRLAARIHVQPGTVARSLLATALEDADGDPRNIVALLDGLPDAFARAQLGLEQARRAETIPIDEL